MQVYASVKFTLLRWDIPYTCKVVKSIKQAVLYLEYTANNIQACIRLIVSTGVILIDIQIDTDLLSNWFDTGLKTSDMLVNRLENISSDSGL